MEREKVKVLILAHCGDETAIRVYLKIKSEYGDEEVKLVSSEELVFAQHWSHRIESGEISTDIQLADNTILKSDSIGVIFNRLTFPTMHHFNWSSERTRNYANMEMYALWMSWLKSLSCPVVNKSSIFGIGIQRRSMAEWLFLSGKAGLPTDEFFFTSSSRYFQKNGSIPHVCLLPHNIENRQDIKKNEPPALGIQPLVYLNTTEGIIQTALIVGEVVINPFNGRFQKEFQQLRSLIGCDLFQVFFSMKKNDPEKCGKSTQNWYVSGISTFPNCSDTKSISLIANHLVQKSRGYP
jgi:hypothetical protein